MCSKFLQCFRLRRGVEPCNDDLTRFSASAPSAHMHAVGLAVKRWGGLLLILAMLSSVAVGQDATDAATDATPTPTPTPTPSAAEDATEPATDVW